MRADAAAPPPAARARLLTAECCGRDGLDGASSTPLELKLAQVQVQLDGRILLARVRRDAPQPHRAALEPPARARRRLRPLGGRGRRQRLRQRRGVCLEGRRAERACPLLTKSARLALKRVAVHERLGGGEIARDCRRRSAPVATSSEAISAVSSLQSPCNLPAAISRRGSAPRRSPRRGARRGASGARRVSRRRRPPQTRARAHSGRSAYRTRMSEKAPRRLQVSRRGLGGAGCRPRHREGQLVLRLPQRPLLSPVAQRLEQKLAVQAEPEQNFDAASSTLMIITCPP